MEDRTYKQFAVVIIIAIIAAIAVYGSWLPMRKGEMFISMLQSLQTTPASSLQDLEDRVAVPLKYPSPSGQEELVRNMANSVLVFVQQGADPTSTTDLINFMNTYYDPIIARGKGMSFGQDLYLEGVINELAFAQTGKQDYIDSAKKYFLQAQALGPNRPQALYGLFDIYRGTGDATDTITTGEKILMNWPTDTRIAQALAQFESTIPKKK